jgi:DNA-binding transcriptional regulator GbsR (MarR family)
MGVPAVLSEAERGLVEAAGLQLESLGLPRIGGRIFGLMLVAPRPLALDEVARLLGVSRASVSINTRLLMMGGIIEPYAIPSDRRRFYRIGEYFFERRLELARQYLAVMNRVAGSALERMTQEPPDQDNPAGRARLRTVVAFTRLMTERVDEILPAMRQILEAAAPGEPPFGFHAWKEPGTPPSTPSGR